MLKFLYIEFLVIIVMGLIFGLFFPFDDPFKSSRLFTQSSEMRMLISSVRILLELLTILLIVNWVLQRKINLDQVIKLISIVLIINVSVGIIDYFSGYHIKTMINPESRIISGRFTGLSGEPRAFGRYSSFGFIFLLYFQSFKYEKLRNIALIFSLIGISLSFSASTIVITALGLTIYFFTLRKFKSAAGILVFGIFAFSILSNNAFFQNQTIEKIKIVLGDSNLDDYNEKVSNDEPAIFSRFEVFDRAALNFFYHNPEYLLFGVGPDLISIPASPYLTYYASKIYENGINTTPATYLINTLSRSGVFGVILHLLFFLFLFKRIKSNRVKFFYLTFMLMSLLVSSSLIYFFTGLVVALKIKNDQQILKIKKYGVALSK